MACNVQQAAAILPRVPTRTPRELSPLQVRGQGEGERPREDDARCGSDSPKMVASLQCGEVEINAETGVPFLSPIRRALIAC